MPKIKRYDRLLPHYELGEAELIIDKIYYDASKMSVAEMLVIYEPEMRTADKVVLVSSEVGRWNYYKEVQGTIKKWQKEG